MQAEIEGRRVRVDGGRAEPGRGPDRGDPLRVGVTGLRLSLVVVLVWIGGMKWTAVEADAISGLIANSPLMRWLYAGLGVRETAVLIGVAELVIAGLIALRPRAPRLAAFGCLLAVGMFATTLSFLLSTPGVFEPAAGGFPALSVLPGQFLLKDVVLLAASLVCLFEAQQASRGA
ncbi:MAG: DUF417 family protein [Myxococcota bacterium]